MNQVWLNGRLAADPEGGESGQGVTYATFSVAIERGSGENKQTIFVDCCAFRQTADFIRQYFSKGAGINVVGSINVRDWTDQSGIKHRKFEVIVDKVGFPMTGRSKNGGNSGQGERQNAPRNNRPPVAAGNAAPPPPYEPSY